MAAVARVPGFEDLPRARRARARALGGLWELLARTPALPAPPRWARRLVGPVRRRDAERARVPARDLPSGVRPTGAPRASIIVPTRGAPTLAQCLAALDAHTGVPFELVLVDDAAPRPIDGARVRHRSRRGFVASANAGARLASTDALVFLNDDAIVTPGWLRALLDAAALPRVGLVAPASNDTGDAATMPARYADLPGLLAHAAAARGAPRDVEKLSLMCALVDRRAFEAVGGLDEGYGLGLFEDDELCMALRAIGRRVVLVPSAFVHHHGSASFGDMSAFERVARFEVNRRRFERRWKVRWRPNA